MGQLEIHTVNVGQGDTAFLVFKDDSGTIDRLILIDAGKGNKGGMVVNYWMDNFSPKQVDDLIISHWDEDHYGGVNKCSQAGMFVNGCNLYSPSLNRQKYDHFQYEETDNWELPHNVYSSNGIILTCYANEENYISFPVGNTANDLVTSTPTNMSSLIFIVTLDRTSGHPFRYYTGGDINEATETALVSKIPDGEFFRLSSMKISHHGSYTSTSPSFLEKTTPMMAIISVGNNTHGHPSPQVLNLLAQKKILTLKTNNIRPNSYMCAAISGNSIKQIITDDDSLVEAAFNKEQGRRIGIFWSNNSDISLSIGILRFIALFEYRSIAPTTNSLLPDTPLGKLLQQYFVTIPLTVSPDGNSCRIPQLPIHSAFHYVLNDCEFRMEGESQTSCTGIWKGIPLTGTIDNKGHLSLESTDSKVEIPLMDLLRFAFGEQIKAFSMLPDALLPKVTISKAVLDLEMGMPRAFQMAFTTQMNGEIAMSEKLRLSAPCITLSSGFMEMDESRGVQNINVCLSAEMRIETRSLKFSMHFSTSPVWKLSIDSENVTVRELILLVPSFNGGLVEQWCNWMGLQNLSIRRASIGVLTNGGIRLHSVEFGFSIKLFSRFSTLLNWTHRINEGDTVDGEIEENINLYDLLDSIGVSRSHMSFLPDVTVESCTFSATPSHKSFSVSAAISFEEERIIKLGELQVGVDSIKIEIEKEEATTQVDLCMDSSLNGALMRLHATYSATDGFVFSGELQQIDIAHLLETVMPVKGTLVSRFDAKLKEVTFSLKKGDILFAAEMPVIVFSEQVRLEHNKMMVHIVGKQSAFSVNTQLLVTSGGQTVVAEGAVAVSPESIYFFAAIQTPFYNVLGINGLNIGNLRVCLSENLTPPGMGIGLMGELAFGKLQGDIALYFSPQNPGKELVAVNFNGLSLLDIVTVFVQCQEGGVGAILESIALQPILIAENLVIPESDCSSACALIDAYEKGDKGVYEIQTHEKYLWIAKNKRVIKNKSNFKTYELVNTDNGKCYLQKYVGLYACINPKGEGIVLNGVNFRPGFAFCARLLFLGMRAYVDFTAEPHRGIKLTAEMESSLKIGNWLQICRVEDANKGPVLSLCTYPESFAFYFSAKIKVLSLLEEQARIAFADNKFAFMLYSNVLGFRSTIEAGGNLDSLHGGGFTLFVAFETNGFSEVTSVISDFLHQKADEIDRGTREVAQKLENARRTLNEHQRDLAHTQDQIRDKERYLNELRHTSYPWYKAYMYIALGVRMAGVVIEIGALAAYKLVVIGVLKVAEGVLLLAEKAVQAAGTVAAETMRIIGDVTAIIGKSIDWLIRLDEIKARLELDANHLLFNFHIHYQLCGEQHDRAFELASNGSLKDTLIQLIKGVFTNAPLISNDSRSSPLDEVYGAMTEQEKRQITQTDWESIEGLFEKAATRGDVYSDILNGMQKDMEWVDAGLNPPSNDADSIPLTIFSDSLTYADIKKLTEDLDRAAVACHALDVLDRTTCENDFNTLQTAMEYLKTEQNGDNGNSGDIYLQYQITRKKSLKWLDKGSGQQQMICSLLEKSSKHFTGMCSNREEKTVLPDGYIHEIINRYQKIVDESPVSPYTKMLFCENLSFAWQEEGDQSQSKKYAEKAMGLATKIWGMDSEELQALKGRLNLK